MMHGSFRDAEILPDPGALLLSADDHGMLAPVFDGVMALYEAVLGRPIVTGEGSRGSDDERRLIGLIAAPVRDPDGIVGGGTMAIAFDRAIRLARIMIFEALGRPFDRDPA